MLKLSAGHSADHPKNRWTLFIPFFTPIIFSFTPQKFRHLQFKIEPSEYIQNILHKHNYHNTFTWTWNNRRKHGLGSLVLKRCRNEGNYRLKIVNDCIGIIDCWREISETRCVFFVYNRQILYATYIRMFFVICYAWECWCIEEYEFRTIILRYYEWIS